MYSKKIHRVFNPSLPSPSTSQQFHHSTSLLLSLYRLRSLLDSIHLLFFFSLSSRITSHRRRRSPLLVRSDSSQTRLDYINYPQSTINVRLSPSPSAITCFFCKPLKSIIRGHTFFQFFTEPIQGFRCWWEKGREEDRTGGKIKVTKRMERKRERH